jgi:hypothetical protein
MHNDKNESRLHAVRREPDELSVEQIDRLIAFGRREAELIDEMTAASRAGDEPRVLEIVGELVRIEDEAAQ